MPAARARSDSRLKKAFGEALRELRGERGLSQEQLAHAIDSGRTYVGELERGQKGASVQWLFLAARVLEVQPSEIIHLVEQKLSWS